MRTFTTLLTSLSVLLIAISAHAESDKIHDESLSREDVEFLDSIGVKEWPRENLNGYNEFWLKDCEKMRIKYHYPIKSESISPEECKDLEKRLIQGNIHKNNPASPEMVEKEVGLTTVDGEYQIWDNLPVDNTTPESSYKAIDGTDLKEWLKKHSNYFDKYPRPMEEQSLPNSTERTQPDYK